MSVAAALPEVISNASIVSMNTASAARMEGVGWCPDCDDFTTPGVEPNQGFEQCVRCSRHRACGVSRAVAAGYLIMEVS